MATGDRLEFRSQQLFADYGAFSHAARRVAGKTAARRGAPLHVTLSGCLCRPRPGARRGAARHQRGSYFIAASYILATWSQLTRWSMKALR